MASFSLEKVFMSECRTVDLSVVICEEQTSESHRAFILFKFKVVLSQNCVTFIVSAPDVRPVRFLNLSLVTF